MQIGQVAEAEKAFAQSIKKRGDAESSMSFRMVSPFTAHQDQLIVPFSCCITTDAPVLAEALIGTSEV